MHLALLLGQQLIGATWQLARGALDAWAGADERARRRRRRLSPPGLALLLALLLPLALLILALIAPFQVSTLVWPVPVPPDGQSDQGWQAGGWSITSPFGWRRDPLDPTRIEFHDGIDLGGPPLCAGCPVVSVLDGRVERMGWDRASSAPPGTPADQVGGGLVVETVTGAATTDGPSADLGEMLVQYAHLEPYRVHVQLQGRVEDPWDRPEYRALATWQPLGSHPDLPAVPDSALETVCDGPGPLPELVWRPSGPGTWTAVYDRPVHGELVCTTTVRWPAVGGGWRGWQPVGATALRWQTPLDPGVRAGDVALRFQATLEPPPPPPTPTPTPLPTPVAVAPSTPSAPPVAVAPHPGVRRATRAPGVAVAVPNAAPDCRWTGLAPLPGVWAPDARLQRDAAASFAAVRAAVREQIGLDPLARLSEALRPPAYATNKPGVLFTSWHKAGRAIDLFIPDQGRIFEVVPEGRRYRVYARGPRGRADLTALFEAHGWSRIPAQGSVPEWWHYEYHPDGISWQSAMQQIYPIDYLRQVLPQFTWDGSCTGGSEGPPDPGLPDTDPDACQAEPPRFAAPVEELRGCGPPVYPGMALRQLDTRIGRVGMSGRTTGAHLHLGLRLRTATGAPTWWVGSQLDVCRTEPYAGQLRALGVDPAWPMAGGQWLPCWTMAVDPDQFLPRAPGGPALAGARDAPQMDEPYQLPPPETAGATLFAQPRPWWDIRWPWERVPGEYWSPYAETGRFGGGGLMEWICWILSLVGLEPAACQG